MTVRVIGVRHHSPACARLVARVIAQERPAWVLIEGPSDFNARLPELLLEHTLPIALYSYSATETGPAQCWYPFVEYSPEWVALHAGHESGAQVRFIDLPHWQYRTLPDARKRIAQVGIQRSRPRYATMVARLCERFHCDGDDALWDHLFESLPATAHDQLQERLALYFAELRGDDPSGEQDQAREQRMAQWIAWAQAQDAAAHVLVICGGWHKRALEALWPALNVSSEPLAETPVDARAAGSYLVPYEFRLLDALGGYASGMQSPLFYQTAWEHGPAAAHRHAMRDIIERLRAKRIAFSTADVMAFERQSLELSRLRGHEHPLRVDILDALQSSLVKEALDAPAPWTTRSVLTSRDHPGLREALMALTGEVIGRLHTETPLPTLVHDVELELERCSLQIGRSAAPLVLDRRRTEDAARAEVLWRLSIIQISGVQLKQTQAPRAARHLPAQLQYEEHWSMVRDQRWLPDLIEAAAYGATLQAAARSHLLDELQATPNDVPTIARCMLAAVRAGLLDMGVELANQLRTTTAALHDHAAIARGAHTLIEVVQAGFWGSDTRELMEHTLVLLAERILWLLETHQSAQPGQLDGDVAALRVFDSLLRLQVMLLDRSFVLETLQRFALGRSRPPAVRGAALGICYVHGHLGATAQEQLLALTRSIDVRTGLGDFLYGLFACARGLVIESDDIVQALHGAFDAMSTEDFLVALPQLRGAFSWFPPRERGSIAARIARLLGLSAGAARQLTKLTGGTDTLLNAKRIESQALQWAQELGVLP